MAKLLAETGINIYQHFESTNPPVVQTDLPACVIGPLFQMKYDEPVSVTDMTLYTSVAGVYDVNTKFLDDENLPTGLALTMKVMITAPASLAGVYDILEVDDVLKRIKISSASVIPTIGASGVEFSVYNPNKSYVGYGMTVGYPGILKFTDTEKNPVVDLASVKVKINDINGDHTIPAASTKVTSTAAVLTNNGTVVKLALPVATDISSVTTGDSLEVSAPAGVAGFYRILSINLVKERSSIKCYGGSTLTGGDYFSLFDENDAESKIWYEIDGAGTAPAGTSVVKVALVGTETAAAVATATKNAITASLPTKFTATVLSDVVTVECVATGNTPDATDSIGATATAFTFNEVQVQGDKSFTVTPESAITVPASTTGVTATVTSAGVITSSTGVKLTSNIPYKGSIKVSYKAARKDMFDQFIRVQYASELVALAGTTTIDDPENTLVYGLYCAITNAGEAVEVLGVAIAADDAASHTSAVEFLQLKKEAYIVTPLTQELAYLEIYKNHVFHVSDPLERWEAMAFLNRALPVYATKTANGSVNGPAISDVTVEAGGSANVYNLVNDAPGSDFYVYGITTSDVVRMVVNVDGVVSTIECPVNANPTIANKTKIQFTTVGGTMGDFTFPVDLTSVDVFKYEVISEKFETASAADKARQVQEMTTWLEASASSVVGTGQSSRRVVYIMPDLVEVPTSLDVRIVPGYFLAAAVAGYKSSLPPHIPLAETAMAGFNKLFHAGNYFSNLQIRTMESAGCMFFVQPTDSSAPRARRQLTNDVSSIKTMEISTVSVVDLFAKRVRAALSPLVARNVMNDNLINTVKLYIESVVSDFNEKGYWRGFEITDFKVNPNATDRLFIAGNPDTFDPFNGADFHLYIS